MGNKSSTLTEIDILQSEIHRLKLEKSRPAPPPTQRVQVRGVDRCTQTDDDDIFFIVENIHNVNRERHRTSYTPYSFHITEMWFSTTIIRPLGVEPYGSHNVANIEMYNTSPTTWGGEGIIQRKVAQLLMSGDKMYYHATDAGSVKNILENGIDLTKSFRSIDFSSGRGFYVTENFQKAVEWSERVGRWMRDNRKAVIGFKISKRLREEEPHLSLIGYNNTDKKLWECVVSHFRHGARSPDVTNILRNMKFIEGPVALNRYLSSEEIPSPFPFNQMCICDANYAKRFGSLQNISFVLFFC